MIIKFDVRGERLTCDKDLVITEGNKGTYEAEFVFDSAWHKYAKVCVFENEGECIPVPVIENKSILPLAEIISAKIGVIGVEVHDDGKISTRISTNMLSVSVRNGAADSKAIEKLEKEAQGWEIYLKALDEKIEETNEIVDAAVEQITKTANDAAAVIDNKADSSISMVNKAIDAKIEEGARFIENLDKEVEDATKVVSELVEKAQSSEEEAHLSAEEAKETLGMCVAAVGGAQEAEANAAEYAGHAQDSQESAEQALSDLLAMINSGDIILAQNGKLPLSAIPATATQEIYVVENENELTSLVAQRGDLAELVETIGNERTITKTWQCLGNPTVRNNWVVWGTSYAVSAGNADNSSTAVNAMMINGHRLVEMSEAEFENAVKDDDTYYLVY